MNGSVLVVDDDTDMCELIRDGLEKRAFEVEAITDGEAALRRMQEREFDVIVTDIQLGTFNGLDLCKRVVACWPDVPVVVITGHGAMEVAVSAIRAGAYDFLHKPFKMVELALTLERAVRHRQLQDEVKRLRRALEEARRAERLIGESPAMHRVYELVEQVAESDAAVLVRGESGTGKEMVARAIHERSGRRDGPFMAVDCAGMHMGLLESELFGTARDALTEATRLRQGLLVQAGGGTLFLDEIGEMSLEMQARLVRALQARRVRPVGGEVEVPFDTRIIAATSENLEAAVAQERFREDLYDLVDVACIHVPPLRARGNDILLLAQHFLERHARRNHKSVVGLSSAAAQKLLAYDWPGNVRELERSMERAVFLARFLEISADDLPERIRDDRRARTIAGRDEPEDPSGLDEIERHYIRRVLRAVDAGLSLIELPDEMLDDQGGGLDVDEEEPLALDDPLALPSLSEVEQRYVRQLLHVLKRSDKMPRS